MNISLFSKRSRGNALIWIIIVLLVLVLAGVAWFFTQNGETPTSSGPTPITTVAYACNGGKSITASFYNGTSTPPTPAPGQPPTPNGYAMVSLSDGRHLTLYQTISADGVRYSNGNPNITGSESLVFWSKGNGALVLENNQNQTYTGCIATVPDPGGLPNVYQNGTLGFSVRYPQNFTVNPTYQYQELGPGKEIPGVKFTIDPAIAKGTNLGSDSYISIEQLKRGQCAVSSFLQEQGPGPLVPTTVTDNGTQYSVASSTGAGAGNRYEEWVYILPGTNPCTAIRYFIHYGVIENYPSGSVQQFNEAALLSLFDSIRRTLTLQ